MMTNRIDFISLNEFIQEVLEEFAQVYICYVIIVEEFLPHIYTSQVAQISIANAQLIILTDAYKDFENVFSIKNPSYLALYKVYNHLINLIDDCQLPYKLIYSLLEKKLFILQVYIDKNLANEFIKPSKSLANTPVLFVLNLIEVYNNILITEV